MKKIVINLQLDGIFHNKEKEINVLVKLEMQQDL